MSSTGEKNGNSEAITKEKYKELKEQLDDYMKKQLEERKSTVSYQIINMRA